MSTSFTTCSPILNGHLTLLPRKASLACLAHHLQQISGLHNYDAFLEAWNTAALSSLWTVRSQWSWKLTTSKWTFQQLMRPEMGKTKQLLRTSEGLQHEECNSQHQKRDDKRLNNHIFTVAKVVLSSLRTFKNFGLLFVTSDCLSLFLQN